MIDYEKNQRELLQGFLQKKGYSEELERHLIQQALQDNGGIQTRAAEKLGISERVLRYKLQKFGLQQADLTGNCPYFITPLTKLFTFHPSFFKSKVTAPSWSVRNKVTPRS